MIDANKRLREISQKQIEFRDRAISALKRENEVHSIVNKNQKKKYKTIILLMSVLLMISSGISIYNLIF